MPREVIFRCPLVPPRTLQPGDTIPPPIDELAPLTGTLGVETTFTLSHIGGLFFPPPPSRSSSIPPDTPLRILSPLPTFTVEFRLGGGAVKETGGTRLAKTKLP